ncbi:MAG TPA: toll/interleukin-1 receptor domain-containing protein [Pirellulaceae bacterium]|nr:toll/interleukin-1 receptor domain-containing protein [Pirellulaceae bacterium]HMO93811.1 toll/interleukin-1 receptor domain-containing protein [Pirellulaceae bacterium]HMP70595.1 toll/interleukin-1 receptor domain-containing protein [Pirellulaceae bacterium]
MSQSEAVPKSDFLDDREWQSLLREIHRGQVIPVVGPALVTVEDNSGESVPLNQFLAPMLAAELNVGELHPSATIHDVARQFLFSGGKRRELYICLADIVEKMNVPIPSELIELARISDFPLLISSTCDPLLVKAVEAARPGFVPERGVIRFHYKGNPGKPGSTPLSGNPESPCDLPATFRGPLVYHILGDYQTQPDFAVWEEDYMEFICGLIENRDTLKNLFQNISSRHLLLLGAPSEDWIVRFFLRAAYGERLSERGQEDYLADRSDTLGEPMIFFLNKLVRSTRIIDGSPGEFVRQLAARWARAYQAVDTPETFIDRQSDHPTRGSVFISYSHRDLASTARVAHALASAGVPVWLDKQRLQLGDNYETRLEYVVKSEASFFLSLISRHTEDDPNRYVHKERAWAAQKHVDGYVYYIPLVIDDVDSVKLEPACFAKIHRERLSDTLLPKFVQRMCSLMEQYRDSGYPRG